MTDALSAAFRLTTFRFECDPGHGWLLVTPAQLAAAGLGAADISPYSYRSPDGATLALEEDRDAGRFLDAWQARIGAVAFREVFRDPTAIRSWPSFGTWRSPS